MLKCKKSLVALIAAVGLISGLVAVAVPVRVIEAAPLSQLEADVQLLEAAENGNIDRIIYALDNGADVNTKDWEGLTPLHRAAFYDHEEAVSLLIKEGADLKARTMVFGYTPLHLAAIQGCRESVSLLVRNGADASLKNNCNQTPLDLAFQFNKQEIINLLNNFIVI